MAILRECLKAVRMKHGTWNADERLWPVSDGLAQPPHSPGHSRVDAPVAGEPQPAALVVPISVDPKGSPITTREA